MYDIVVVGAGPSGSFTALTAAKEGCKVVLIEEHKEIGIPFACGEGISSQWLSKFVNPKQSWIAAVVNSARFYSPSGRSFSVRYPGVGYILERKVFDRDLAVLAANAGADVRVGVKSIGLTDNGIKTTHGEIKAKIVVGADGVESKVGRWAGIDTRLGKADFWVAHEYLLGGVDVTPGETEFMLGRELVPGGYFWVFPKGDGLANVGIGVYPLLTNKPPKFFNDALIKHRFKKFSILGEYKSIIPSKALKKLVNHNVCLVGDAARLVDPISGGGIGNALLSGQLAGKACALAIKSGDISKLKVYEKEWETAEGRNFRFKLKVRDIAMKLKDSDFELLFDFGSKNFADKDLVAAGFTLRDEFKVIRDIITFSPKFLKLGAHLLKEIRLIGLI